MTPGTVRIGAATPKGYERKGFEEAFYRYLPVPSNASASKKEVIEPQLRHRGMIGLDFTRSASSAEEALRSAVRDVQRAIPGTNLVQVGPDLVGLTEMAEIFSFSRQNMRKYATGKSSLAHTSFPTPTVIGEPSLWHLAEIVSWFQRNTEKTLPPNLLEISKATATINFEIEESWVRKIAELA